MKNEIFNGANFGDMFLIKDGRKAVLVNINTNGAWTGSHYVELYVENVDKPGYHGSGLIKYNMDGTIAGQNDDLEVVEKL